MDKNTALAATAVEQHGLLTRQQLDAAGYAAPDIERLRDAGELVSIRRCVYRLASWPQSPEQVLLSHCLHPGHDVVLSHLTAATHYGLFTSCETHVTVRWPDKLSMPGAFVHRSRDLASRHVRIVDGIPFTTPERTLIDLGLCLPPSEVSRCVDHAIATRLVDPPDLWHIRLELSKQGRNGAGTLDTALRSLPVDAVLAESGPEVALVRFLLANLYPQPELQYPVTCGSTTYRIDVAYPEVMLAIEYDGEAFHSSDVQRANDAARQERLERAGWHVVRVTKADFEGLGSAIVHKIRRFAVLCRDTRPGYPGTEPRLVRVEEPAL